MLYEQLRTEITALPQTSQLCKQVVAGTIPQGWIEKDGLLLFQDRIFLLDDSTLWPIILEQSHTMRHEGSEKMLHQFRAVFYSP
jgi:hypothetical protein